MIWNPSCPWQRIVCSCSASPPRPTSSRPASDWNLLFHISFKDDVLGHSYNLWWVFREFVFDAVLLHVFPTHGSITCRGMRKSQEEDREKSQACFYFLLSFVLTEPSFTTSMCYSFSDRRSLFTFHHLFSSTHPSGAEWQIQNSARTSGAISNRPLTLNIWCYGREGDPVNGSPCLPCQHHKNGSPQGEQGGMCVERLRTDTLHIGLMFNRHQWHWWIMCVCGRSYCKLNDFFLPKTPNKFQCLIKAGLKFSFCVINFT